MGVAGVHRPTPLYIKRTYIALTTMCWTMIVALFPRAQHELNHMHDNTWRTRSYWLAGLDRETKNFTAIVMAVYKMPWRPKLFLCAQYGQYFVTWTNTYLSTDARSQMFTLLHACVTQYNTACNGFLNITTRKNKSLCQVRSSVSDLLLYTSGHAEHA